MPAWPAATIGGLMLLTAALLVGWWWAGRRWHAKTEDLRARLLAERRSTPRAYTRQELEGLPAPVVRYFQHTLRDGQPIITAARITWAGTFNMGRPGADKWAPFTAVQDFVPGAPGMVWDARIAMVPGLTVWVRDAFAEGEGSMYGALMGIFPVVNKAGTPEMARASLQRYMAEAAWLPTALLPSAGVQWTAIDHSRAMATLIVNDVAASVEFRFDADGRSTTAFVADRLYDDGKTPPAAHPWQGRNISFTTADGMVVPDEATVEWLLPQGPYPYWRGRPVTVSFEYAVHPRVSG